MGGNISRYVLLAFSFLLLLSSISLAAPFGAVTTAGQSERGNGTGSSGATIHGGNVTQTNVSGISITSNWAGFFGNIGGSVQLADSAANKFFEWTVANFTGSVVYAANGTVNNWDLRAMNESFLPSNIATGQDRYNLTFTQAALFQTNGVGPISNAPFTRTYQGGTMGILRTYALLTSDNSINIWAAVAIQNSTSFKSGVNVDYQILVPAKTSGTQYNFYLELP